MPYLSQDSDGEAGPSDAPTSDHDHDQNDVESVLPTESASGAAAVCESHNNDDDSGLGPVSESDADEGSSESASASACDDGRGGHGKFFDLEASESHDSDDSEDDQDDDGSSDDEGSYLDSFPQFSRLPAELRRMIWEAFCPDLTSSQGRVYDIVGHPYSAVNSLRMTANITLPQRTQRARTVLAVHRQSRSWALKAFPDELSLPFGHATDILRFDKQKDIILLRRAHQLPPQNPFWHQIHNLAVSALHYSHYDFLPRPGSDELPNLKQLFFVVRADECQPEMSFSWCATKDTIVTTPTTFIEKLDRHKFIHTYQYCWPDVKKWPNFSGYETELYELWRVGSVPPPSDIGGTGDPLNDDFDSDSDSDSETDDEMDERVRRIVRSQLSKLPAYPLVEFENDLDLLEKIQAWNGEPNDWNPAWGGHFTDEEDLTPDEYASSGIDDSEIEEEQDDDDDDDDVIVVDDSDELGSDNEAEGGSTDEFPQQFEPAHFSSPDEESATVRGDSSASDDDESGTQTRRAVAKRRSRARIVESDSDSDGVGAPGPHDRSVNKTGITIDDSSDEDESPAGSSKKPRRAKRVSSSSESSSDNNADTPPRERKRKRKVLDDSSSSSSEDDAPVQRSRKSRPTRESSPSSDDEVPNRRSRKRKIVSDDSDSDDPAPRKRVRQSRTRADSDSEDDPDPKPDETDTSDEESPPNKNPTKRRRNNNHQPSDSDSESDSSSSGSESNARPLSLAERLALHRRENPIPDSESDSDDMDSDNEEGDEEGHDGGIPGEYAYNGGFQDDDEDEGDSEAHEEGFLDEEGDEEY